MTQDDFPEPDDPIQPRQPAHVSIMAWLVFFPGAMVFILWGLRLALLDVPRSSTVSALITTLYYLGLLSAVVMGSGLLILIAGYFAPVHSADDD